ncbi:MAG: glycosyltransferase family 2 protein [Chloroflexota bacterium]|nr:MAG: glycosyltransferase family 2 protein [Chloroflexota bacterium]
MTACSIIIRAYNEEEHIGRLLEGISQQTIQDVQVILVDSGSTDATVAIAARYTVEIVHVHPEEFTFGRSLNLGIQRARADLVVIASAHVYPVYPDWLECLLAPFVDPTVALSYGKQRGGAATRFSEHQVFAHWFPDQRQPRQAHPFCNNANAAIRRSLWENRPYDETVPGLEDVEWAHWALEQGYGLAYVPEAEIIHIHNERPRSVYNRYRREAMAFKRIFPQERFRLYEFARLFTTNVLSDIWHASRQKLLASSLNNILWFRFMQFWGTYQGYRHSGPLTWQLRQTFYYPHQMSSNSRTAPRDVEPIRY